MRLFYTDLKNKNLVLLGIIVLSGIAAFTITNLQFTFWDFDLFPYIEPGKISHYYINYYDFGFVKRGLVSTLITTTGYPSVSFVNYFAYSIGIVICTFASYLIYKMRTHFNNWGYWLFSSFIIFSPATFMNWGYDLGRFDQLLIICSILSFYFIKRGSLLNVLVISTIALLIHELYIIMFFPILFYVMIFHSKFDFRQLGYLMLGIGIIISALFFFGKIEGKSVEEIANTISVDGFKLLDYGTIWKSSLKGNIVYTAGIISDFSSAKIIPLIYGACYTLLVFTLLIMISTFNKMDWYGYIVILLASAPIFFLAIDYSRWYSLMVINGFLYFGFCSFSEKEREHTGITLTKQHLAVCSLLLIFGLVLGPIGIIHSFPLFNFF